MTTDYRNPEHTKGEYNPPIAHYRHIEAPEDENITLSAMGKGGRAFIGITKSARVKYIWYNKEQNIIEIYGPKDNLQEAEKRLRDRIKWVKMKHANEEEDTVSYEVPERLHNHIGMIVGKYGKVFKAIKHQSAVRDIKWNSETGCIEITGPQSCLDDAKERVKERVQTCDKQISNTTNEQ